MTVDRKPKLPYYAVIFSSVRTPSEDDYEATAQRLWDLAAQQPGFLGAESVRNEGCIGITVSYWESLEAIRAWKSVAEHREAQRFGRERWYRSYRVRICRVENEYEYEGESA